MEGEASAGGVAGSGPRFEVYKLNLFGNPNIGVYMLATDKYVIVSEGITREEEEVIESVLRPRVLLKATVLGTRLVGVLMAGNSNGLLLPGGAEEEVPLFEKELGVAVGVLPSRHNAVGNIIVANDKAGLAHPGLEDQALKAASEILGVELHRRDIAGVTTVGSAIVVTNRGAVVHPDASDEEIEELSRIFGVPVEPGTVNFGMELVRTGLVANSYGALVGEETSGPEIARIQTALGGGVRG